MYSSNKIYPPPKKKASNVDLAFSMQGQNRASLFYYCLLSLNYYSSWFFFVFFVLFFFLVVGRGAGGGIKEQLGQGIGFSIEWLFWAKTVHQKKYRLLFIIINHARNLSFEPLFFPQNLPLHNTYICTLHAKLLTYKFKLFFFSL